MFYETKMFLGMINVKKPKPRNSSKRTAVSQNNDEVLY